MRKIQRFAFLLTSFFTLSGMAVPGWADHPVSDFRFARESEMLLQSFEDTYGWSVCRVS